MKMKATVTKLGLITALLSANVYAQTGTWSTVGQTGISNPISNFSSIAPVYSFSVDNANNVMYVGGNYAKADSKNAWCITKFDGNNFTNYVKGSSYGSNAPILATYFKSSNEIYVGGFFTGMMGETMNHISKWNGTAWIPMGQAVSGNTINAITEYNGQIYAGGWFGKNLDTGFDCFNIVRWNGTSWTDVGGSNPISGVPVCMIVFNSKLYVGTDANKIFAWNGSSWTTFATADGLINSFTILNNELYAGGRFTQIGGVSANYIAKYTGSQWKALGSGMDDHVNSVCAYNNRIYAGGKFTIAGGIAAKRVASWNGTSWSALGGGTNSDIQTVAVMNNALYVGGDFTKVNTTITASYMAKYAFTGTGINDNATSIAKLNVYPNPFNSETIITLPDNYKGGTIEVLNLLGQKVKVITQSAQSTSAILSKEGLSAGIYIVNLTENGRIVANEKLIVE